MELLSNKWQSQYASLKSSRDMIVKHLNKYCLTSTTVWFAGVALWSRICLRLINFDQDFMQIFFLVFEFVDLPFLYFSKIFYIFLFFIICHPSLKITLVFSGFGFHCNWRLAWWTFVFSLDANHSVLFRAARNCGILEELYSSYWLLFEIILLVSDFHEVDSRIVLFSPRWFNATCHSTFCLIFAWWTLCSPLDDEDHIIEGCELNDNIQKRHIWNACFEMSLFGAQFWYDFFSFDTISSDNRVAPVKHLFFVPSFRRNRRLHELDLVHLVPNPSRKPQFQQLLLPGFRMQLWQDWVWVIDKLPDFSCLLRKPTEYRPSDMPP